MAALIPDLNYRAKVREASTKEQVDALFAQWWPLVYVDGADKTALLERWFGVVLVDERVHGAKLPLFATSQSSEGELTGDSAGLVCEPSTAATAGRDDFARLPQFWALEVSADKDADGRMVVYKVQHIDPLSEVRSGEHLCQVLVKNTYYKEWQADGYHFHRQQCTLFEGAALWQPKNAAGYQYSFASWPKYLAGWTDGTKTALTCGTNLHPAINVSHTAGLTKWRSRNANYAGLGYRTVKWQNSMFALKYARKGNSGLIEGCTSYNYEYAAAVSEEGVERVVLTTAQAANLLEGSAVSIAGRGGSCVRIASIEEVEIGGTTYAAVNLDNGGTTFNVTAGTTKLSAMPWWSGRCDTVKGLDGSCTNNTNGKEPGMIQGTEFGIGAYDITADALMLWTQDGNNYALDLYTCDDPSKASGSAITADYQKAAPTLEDPANGWQYIQDEAVSPAVWPLAVGGGAGSSNGCRAALYVSRSSGVRAVWGFGNLDNGGHCGRGCLNSNNAPGNANWNGCLGAPSNSVQTC